MSIPLDFTIQEIGQLVIKISKLPTLSLLSPLIGLNLALTTSPLTMFYVFPSLAFYQPPSIVESHGRKSSHLSYSLSKSRVTNYTNIYNLRVFLPPKQPWYNDQNTYDPKPGH